MNLKHLLLALSLGLATLGCGGSGSAGNINVRTVNLVRGAGTINVTADTGILATALAYGTSTPYGTLNSFAQSISATDPTQGVTLGNITLSANAGNFYTLYAIGVENGTPASNLVLLQDTQPATSAVAGNVRFGAFSTSITGNVDVYITSTTTGSLSGLTPNYSNVAYGSVSPYVQIAGGTYKVWVTATGNPTTVEATASPVSIANGSDYSIYGTDNSATSASVVVITDSY